MCTTIQGETQGQKHKNFNKLVFKSVGNKKVFNFSIDYDDTDIENLLKVDVACHTRNVDFVLEVFKCKDILFVSRAIRHGTWLVEPEYAHLINPKYLYTQLFPYMMPEGRNKLLLLIRLNLRDPNRFEEFFNYLEKTDTNAAMKWFPKCSIKFILSRLQNNIHILPEHIIFRLFSHSFEAFKIYCDVKCKKSLTVNKALFLIKSNGEEFFDILDQLGTEHIPIFNKKYTKLAMKVCPHRLMFNFDYYQNHIDIQCFIKYMKLERFEEFQSKYGNNEKLISYFEKGRQNVQNLCEGKNILDALGSCDPNNKVNVTNLLIIFKENFSQYSKDLIFKFINKFLSKCNVYQLLSVTWNMYIDVFKEIMNIKQYSENNKTIQSIMQSTVFYQIIHNEIISDDIMMKFQFDNSLRVARKKLSKKEIQIVFDFLLNFALMQVQKTTQQNKVIWIENMFVLFKVWNRSLQEYPLFNIEVIKVIQELQKVSDYEKLKYLYFKNSLWRRYLLNENIIIEPNSGITLINMLKHNPRLLVPLQKKKVIYSEKKLAALFYRKLRTYWSNSLGQQYKDLFYTMLHQSPSVGLYILLSRIELQDFIQCNAPNKHNENVNRNAVQIHIAQHMHKVYPKLPIKMALLYYKGIPMIHALSSINSILHGMSTHQMKESIESFDTWPELVQKLCIWVIFSQPRYDKREFLLTIWQKTKYSSIRAEIFKKSMRSLCIYKDIELNVKYNYIVMISEEWQFLEFIMDNLRKHESLIVDKFPYYFQRLPRMKASNFCLKSYQIMKNFTSQYKIFPRRPLIHYFGGGLHLVDSDLVAAMVNDIITERLWTTKMNNHHLDVVTSCLYTWKDDAEQMVSFRKIIAPLFEKAYEKWDTKIVNCHLVQLNINNIVTRMNKLYQSYLDSKSNFSPSVLTVLLDSLENNISVKENYMMIRSLKLAVELFKILSKANAIVKFDENTNIFDQTSISFAEMCINIFCDDVANYGNSIWRLFYHALQDMLDRFDVKKHTQYKIYNLMLDLSTELTPELNYQVHVLIFELTLYKADDFMYYICSFDSDDSVNDDEGQEKLLTRIKTHHSNKVKAYHSKCVLSNLYDLYYKKM